jgi:hypothetical protein
MKAIVLVSSIFYMLGLKIGQNADLFKKNISPPGIHTNKPAKPENHSKNYNWKAEVKNLRKTNPDSLCTKGSAVKSTPGISR